jgi:hypothetical protein
MLIMIYYVFYLFVGPCLWVAQVVAVVALGALGWRAPKGESPEQKGGRPASLQGRTAAALAAAVAMVSTVLMAPLALVYVNSVRDGRYTTDWTNPFGIVFIVQVLLLLAAVVNTAMVRRAR